MNWNCAQLEARVADFLDARLASADEAAAEAHARACPRCAEWLDARRAVAWLRALEPLEAPPGLETRILAQTTAPAPREIAWAVLGRAWQTMQQPRFALGLAAAVFSFALMLNALGVSPGELRAADLNPINLYRAADRQGHQGYARVVRFVNDLRVVYEIRSRLDELQPEEETPPAVAPPKPVETPPAPEKKSKKSSEGATRTWRVAWLAPGAPGVTR